MQPWDDVGEERWIADGALQESISDRRYTDAATAARKSLPLIRKWLEDPKGNDKRLSLSMPALTQGGTMLALTGDRKGLTMLQDLVSEFDHLEEYRADAEKHFAAIDLFDAIRKVVSAKPGILQNKMKSEVGAEDNPGNEERMKAVNAAYEALTGASHDDLQGKESAEDLLKFAATVTFMTGGGPDRLQSAAFSGRGDTVLLGTSQGRVLRIDGSGKPTALYDVGTTPIRILETDRYLYIQTFTRLYVLEGHRLVGLQDCTTKCDLLVDEGLVLLVENKGVRVLTEAGRPLGVALTKAPIRRAGIEDGVLVVETRTHRGRFCGLMG